jgi:hypothetical protein
LRFSLKLPLDVAEQQVQAAINAAIGVLPADLPMPPAYSKVNPADAPVLTLAISSPSLPITRVHDMVENRLAMRLSQVAGVGLVSIAGAQRPFGAGTGQQPSFERRGLFAGRRSHRHQPSQCQHGQGQFGWS